MTEKDYTIISDLATIRSAKVVLQKLVPDCSEILEQGEYNEVMHLISKWEKQHDEKIKID